METTKDPIYSFDLLLPTRTREYAGEDACPCRCHPSRIMHPAILPELGVIAGSLPVDDSSNPGAVDKKL
jgi:hypothetical protein